MTKVHIHEDNEGMRNLYPVAAYDDVEEDLIAGKKASVENRAPGGIGWTDVHQIKEPDATYAKVGTSLKDMATAVEQHLPRIDHFEVGFGDGNPFHHRDIGGFTFGFGDHLYVRFDTKDDVLLGIWYDVTTSDLSELEALRQTFLEINTVQRSMIADHWMHTGGRIDDEAFLTGYLNEIEQHFAERAAMAPPTPKLTFLQWLILKVFGTR